MPDAPLVAWTVNVGPSRTSPLQIATERAEETLLIAGTAAFVLCVGVVLSVRAVQDRATLAEMRSEFVSSVTHELKMPLANIRAVADTLFLRSVSPDRIRTYGGHLRQEARRLTHLVDNLLAYAKITDVANVYTFEPVVPARLVADALQGFQQPLTEGAFTVDIAVPDDLPLVRADSGAMRLVLDNLLDNGIRYSADVRHIRVRLTSGGKQSCSKYRTEESDFQPKNCRSSDRNSFAAASRSLGAPDSGLASSAGSSAITAAASPSKARPPSARQPESLCRCGRNDDVPAHPDR